MRRILLFGGCLLSLLAASCGENKTVDSRPQEPLSAPQPTQSSSLTTQQPSAASPSNSDTPAPPRDAQFTIVCKAITGPGHVARAKELKDDLIKGSPLKHWYVSHDEEKSTLYYGYYRTIDDPRLKSDREKIAGMQDAIGNRPFAEALPVAVNQPDPTAPPGLNLVNAKGFWSLQIAAYQGPGRKEAAVEAVESARKMGVEAYYYHGPAVSSVCIGAWPEDAIRKQETDGMQGIDPSDQKRPILLLGPGSEMIPQATKEQYAKNLIDKDTGRPVQVLEQKVEVVDPTMRAVMEKYPTHSVNGFDDITQVRDPRTGEMVEVPKPSMIVQIPHGTTLVHEQIDNSTPALLNPGVPSQESLGGRLRSVGP